MDNAVSCTHNATCTQCNRLRDSRIEDRLTPLNYRLVRAVFNARVHATCARRGIVISSCFSYSLLLLRHFISLNVGTEDWPFHRNFRLWICEKWDCYFISSLKLIEDADRVPVGRVSNSMHVAKWTCRLWLLRYLSLSLSLSWFFARKNFSNSAFKKELGNSGWLRLTNRIYGLLDV